jgi:anti-sigma B factor antagonist
VAIILRATRATSGPACFNRPMGDESVEPLREAPVRAVEAVNGSVVIRLAGELDLYNAEEVRAALAQAIDSNPRRVVVDMADVEFVDSTALGVLIEARAKLGREGLALAAPQLDTRRTLQVSGLDRHLPVHDTVEDALAS